MNILTKNKIMNVKVPNISAFQRLNHISMGYDYCSGQSMTPIRHGIERIHNTLPRERFSYEGLEFIMIGCPGGTIELYNDEFDDYELKYTPKFDKECIIEKPFMLGETEVTEELFEKVMQFKYCSYGNHRPVTAVSWYDCVDFCNKLSSYFGLSPSYHLGQMKYGDKDVAPLSIESAEFKKIENSNGFRLPTECEWQLAAMAGTNNRYSGTNDIALLPRFAFCDYKDTDGKTTYRPIDVAQKLPNEWGFYDMSGNVEEWCEYLLTRTHPKTKKKYVLCSVRGGSWVWADEQSNTPSIDIIQRYTRLAEQRLFYLGFRIARSI